LVGKREDVKSTMLSLVPGWGQNIKYQVVRPILVKSKLEGTRWKSVEGDQKVNDRQACLKEEEKAEGLLAKNRTRASG